MSGIMAILSKYLRHTGGGFFNHIFDTTNKFRLNLPPSIVFHDSSCRSFRPPVLTYKPTPQLTHLPTPSSRAARFWTTVMYHNLVGIPIPSVKKGAEVLLYQYKICPFCNSVKALLHHQNIPYSSVEVNPLTKSQLGCERRRKACSRRASLEPRPRLLRRPL